MQGQIPPPLSGNYATRELSGIPGWIIEMRSLLARDTRTRWAGPVAAVTTAATVGLVHDTIVWTDAPTMALWAARATALAVRHASAGASKQDAVGDPRSALWVRSGPW